MTRSLAFSASVHVRSRPRFWAPPIFVLGHDRSGSSWLAHVLSKAPGVLYFHEPTNPDCSELGDWSCWNRFLLGGDRDPQYDGIFDAVTSGRHLPSPTVYDAWLRLSGDARVLVKEVAGVLCGEWFQARYGARILVIRRHPVPIIASNLKASGSEVGIDLLDKLLAQPPLFDRYLSGERDWAAARLESGDGLGCLIAACLLKHLVLARQLEAHSEWLSCEYEQLCTAPEKTFRSLMSKLDLPWDSRISAEVDASTSRDDRNPHGVHRNSREMPERWRSEVDSSLVTRVAHDAAELRMTDWEF